MNRTTSGTRDPLDVLHNRCPTRRIGVEVPLSIVEELDNLAGLNHITRQQLLVQLINASLLNDTPHLPAGPDPIGRLAEHAYLTHRRSLELAVASRGR
jgi:hypothetical protein